MIHLALLVGFSAAVGIVLGAMLRRDARGAAGLAAWITLGMVAAATLVGWLLYLLTR